MLATTHGAPAALTAAVRVPAEDVMTDLELRTVGVMIATLGGAAIGVERERSGHALTARRAFRRASGPSRCSGGYAGLCGWLWAAGLTAVATVLAAGSVALVVVAYAATSRREIGGTTEMAALVTIAAGVLAGVGHLALASAAIAVTTLLLVEKSRVHSWSSGWTTRPSAPASGSP